MIISIYFFFICVGIYSLWSSVASYSLTDIMEMYRPLFFSIGALSILLLLFGYRIRAAIFLLYVLSLYILTFMFAGFHGLEWTELSILAPFFLLLMWKIQFLFVMERNRELFFIIWKSTIFSILFLLFIFVFQLVPSVYMSFVILFIYGQAISMIGLSFYTISCFPEWFTQHTKMLVASKWWRRDHSKRKQQSSRISFISSSIIYLILIGLSLFIFQWLTGLLLIFLLIWICSLFMASASFNSFSVAILFHIITLTFVIPIAALLLVYDFGILTYPVELLHQPESELWVGVLFCWAIGILPMVVWQLTRYKERQPYLISFLGYLIILSPLFFVSEKIERGSLLILAFTISYLFIYVSAYVLFVLMEQLLATKSRASRKREYQENLEQNEAEKSVSSRVTYDISKDVRERDLAISYRRMLERRELRLSEQEFKKND